MKYKALVLPLIILSVTHLKAVNIGVGFVFENIDTTTQASIISNPNDYLTNYVTPSWSTPPTDTDNDGIPDDLDPDDDNDGTNDIDDPDHPNYDDPNGGGSDGGGSDGGGSDGGGSDGGGSDGGGSNTGYDTDDDVPMLTQIYQRLATLDKDNDHQNLTNIWNRQADIAGQIQEIEGTAVRMAEIADLEKSLRRIELEMKQTRGEYIDTNGSPTGEYATLKDIVDAINGQSDRNQTGIDINASASSVEGEADKIEEYLETSLKDKKISNFTPDYNSDLLGATFDLEILGKSYYFSPLDPGGTHSASLSNYFDKIPSIQNIQLWIKRIIIVVVLVIYTIANLRLLDGSLYTMSIAPESATVSNYLSIFGVQIGGGVLKAAKITAAVVFFSTIFLTYTVGFVELDIDFGSADTIAVIGNPTGIIDSLLAEISAAYDWSKAAVSMLYNFIPILTIINSISTYWFNRILLRASILTYTQTQKATS